MGRDAERLDVVALYLVGLRAGVRVRVEARVRVGVRVRVRVRFRIRVRASVRVRGSTWCSTFSMSILHTTQSSCRT